MSLNGAPRDGEASGGGRQPPAVDLSPAVLAYIGDAVFGVLVRTLMLDRLLASTGGVPPGLATLHRAVEPLVAADGQARLLLALWPALRPEERDVVRRARNTRLKHRPRSADYVTYRRSTGLEALVGYLYLDGQADRLVELVKRGLELNEGDGAGANGTG